MMFRKGVLYFLSALFVCIATLSVAQERGDSPVLQAMRDELTRSLQALKIQSTPPYFLSYEITELDVVGVNGSFGTITGSSENRRRQLDIDLRVGDYTLDNTRPIRGGFPSPLDFVDRYSLVEIPIEDDPAAIRSILWYHTDAKYKRAVEQLTKVKTNVQVKVEAEDNSSDFSRETAEKYSEKQVSVVANRPMWEEKIRKYSAPFNRFGNIYEARAYFSATAETHWFVNSEGAEIQMSQPRYQLSIFAFTKADDGMELPRYESFFASSPEDLPDDQTVLRAVERMIQDLQALRAAPVVDPYTGPAILSGRASGVFFHEVFGHRIEGHRQKQEEEGQTFKKKINEKIMPDFLSVYFDPTLRRLGSIDLAGSYRYDNQGVKSQRVAVVQNGVFKSFLMSRSPVEGFAHSNGHGRKAAGAAPAARQSNLIVETSSPVAHAQLKKMLIEEIQKQNKPFGLLFDQIQGGVTVTGRSTPNAFNVLPLMVSRVFPDGREELVRGVNLIGTPLTAFTKILAADDQLGVFNGVCGAESGLVPVSAASPHLLVSQIEVQKKEKSQERPPILPTPLKALP